MAKSRITKRGKIRSLTRKAPRPARLFWRKAKTLAMIANRKQWIGEYDIQYTLDTEIATGEGFGIMIETSSQSLPTYIVIE
jgi:hypothetical protein